MTGLRAHRALEQATPGLKIHLICHQTRGVQHHLILWNPLLIDGTAPTPGRGALRTGQGRGAGSDPGDRPAEPGIFLQEARGKGRRAYLLPTGLRGAQVYRGGLLTTWKLACVGAPDFPPAHGVGWCLCAKDGAGPRACGQQGSKQRGEQRREQKEGQRARARRGNPPFAGPSQWLNYPG